MSGDQGWEVAVDTDRSLERVVNDLLPAVGEWLSEHEIRSTTVYLDDRPYRLDRPRL